MLENPCSRKSYPGKSTGVIAGEQRLHRVDLFVILRPAPDHLELSVVLVVVDESQSRSQFIVK